MEANGKQLSETKNKTWESDDENVVISPFAEKFKNIVIPGISVPELLFQAIDLNNDILKNKVWLTDIDSVISYKFCDIKPMTRKIASALTRLGFKKDDVLFFVTYDAALIYMVNIGVWLCGGAIRSSYQREQKEAYVNQMKEVSTRFVLCDPETSVSVKWAAGQLGWNVTILSIGGEVEGAFSIEEMIRNEDGSAFPKDLKINPKEDTLAIINTSGSTGVPKGVMQTHYSYVAYLTMKGHPRKARSTSTSSLLTAVGNSLFNMILASMVTILEGLSYYTTSKFDMTSFMKSLLKYKPETIFLHPYAVHAFLQHPEIKDHDLAFLKLIFSGGSVFNFATAKVLEAKLSYVKLLLACGVTETNPIASTEFDLFSTKIKSIPGNRVAGVKYQTIHGDTHLTCGQLHPMVKAKIVDQTSGQSLGRHMKGSLFIKTPYFMKGYVTNDEKKNITAVVDKNGWFETGDVAFFDEDDFLYIVDRNKFTFKYQSHWVSPTEVEAIILKHPAVVSAVVVGVPDTEKTSIAKAYVVLKPGSRVTEEEIELYVAGKTEVYKHLHGGVVFLESMPVTTGEKLNRQALLKRAIAELRSST